jgi:hypothetical protein
LGEEKLVIVSSVDSSPEKPVVCSSLGFLTVLSEGNGHLGGYLVTNTWGRPLEFRLSSAVQPNRVQQILYGPTLVPYICADLIGKTLMDRAGAAVQMVITDKEVVLELRLKVEQPVLWLVPADEPRAPALAAAAHNVLPPSAGRGPVVCHPRFPQDVAVARALMEQLDGSFDLVEPFSRIREAIGEARKMGVAGR